MILCIGPTPAHQRVMVFENLALDSVNRAVDTVDGIAGKSVNVAKILKALGEKPVAIGFVGGTRGEELKQALDRREIQCDFIRVPAETRQCITVLNRCDGTQTELVEESQRVPDRFYKSLLTNVKKHVRHCEAVVMSGTLTPGAPEKFYFECARAARAVGSIVILDAKGPALMKALEAAPDVIKPNRSELEATTGQRVRTERDLKRAVCALAERGAKNIVITAGSEAAVAFDGYDFWRVTSPHIRAVNPIGSGDAFTAGLAAWLTKGFPFAEACRWAAACGAANALTIMAGEVDAKVVKRLSEKVRVDRV
jgi:1-phosphofructokinase family hexose kinase